MMDRRLMIRVYFLLLVVSEVKGTLTPSGTVSLDCMSQQTFTCSIPGTSVGWNITGLSGITAMGTSGQIAARDNARISTADMSGLTPSSTINITGFTTADNGGVVECINLGDAGVQGMATVAVGVPDAPATFRVEGNDDCINASARWAASVSAMSTIISYCQLSNMNCESVLCGSSPCTISGLMNNEDYDFTVVHNNNCGNSSETTSLRTSPLRAPDHPVNFRVKANDDCTNARATWTASGTATSPNIFISYCPLTSSMNCGSVFCSSSPCTFYGLIRYQEYSITAVHNSSCGNSTVATQSQMSPLTNCLPVRVAAAIGAVIGSLAVVAVIITIVVIVVVCYCCPRARSVCCCCVSGGSKRSTSTEPMKPRPGEEYADPQKVRENKESGKQGGITYAALEFSEQAGSTGGQNVRSNKGEAVQYMAVEHA